MATTSIVDLHSHVLPALDDGPETLEESVEAGRAAVAAGVTILAATPHVRQDYPTTADRMEEALAAVRSAYAREGVGLDLRGGGELDLEWLAVLEPREVRRFGLAGNPSYVLVEFPSGAWPLNLRSVVFQLALEGIAPVLAHPEINPDVQAHPERLRELVDAGALVQVTAASLDGRYGAVALRTAELLLTAELVHLVASDAHGADMRGFDFGGAARRIADPELERWLLHDVPGAIAGAMPLPERPRRPEHVRRGRLRRRRVRED
ncbi:MAG TPA: CpsB/CapC family capsule biosynthesis tyrosine phosphatase [Gaiellaceae bacterium]|nr:CpsB/CapC family capsule biosynthesis tyrosine phosphatase [Gaiellaceae bacterium]